VRLPNSFVMNLFSELANLRITDFNFNFI